MKLTLFGVLILSQSMALAAPKPAETQAALADHWREKLTPGVEALLSQQCGEDCPSFRLEPRFGNSARDSIDDVGFSKPVETDSTPALKSVALTVVHTGALPESSRESLRQILSSRVANEAGVPATVTMQLLSGPSPLQARLGDAAAGNSKTLAYLKAAAWPAAVVLVGLFALFGVALALRARRKLALDLHRAREESLANAKADPVREALAEPLRQEALRLLEARALDLEWFIEDRALQRDSDALQSCIQLFSPTELSARLKLSSSAVKALAALDAPKAAVGAKELKELESSLDFAHWKRLAAERDPLSALGNFPDVELGRVSEKLSSPAERAYLMAKLPEKRWPAVLSRLSSDARVQVGLELSRLSSQADESLRTIDGQVQGAMRAVHGGFAPGALDRLSPYLTEGEFQEIRSQTKGAGAHLSAEAILASMEDPELAELSLRLDLADLKLLLRSVRPVERQRIEGVLPAALRERIKLSPAQKTTPAEADQLKARAAFVLAYRKAFGTEMLQ
jgi:hypothetical protein